jgi:hypothetical protein
MRVAIDPGRESLSLAGTLPTSAVAGDGEGDRCGGSVWFGVTVRDNGYRVGWVDD